MDTATRTWTPSEQDPQRIAILAAADRLLAGTPSRSTGRLSVVQLAIEANVKYWIVAQKHPDLRTHFQKLAAENQNMATDSTTQTDLRTETDRLRRHCRDVEALLELYATVINELDIENRALRQRIDNPTAVIIPLRQRQSRP